MIILSFYGGGRHKIAQTSVRPAYAVESHCPETFVYDPEHLERGLGILFVVLVANYIVSFPLIIVGRKTTHES